MIFNILQLIFINQAYYSHVSIMFLHLFRFFNLIMSLVGRQVKIF